MKGFAQQKLLISLVSNNLHLRSLALRCVPKLLAASITPGEQAIFSLINVSSSKNVVQLHHVSHGSQDAWSA